MISNTLTIFVDADACPVKSEILQIGKKRDIPVHFIASYDHKPGTTDQGGKWTFVDPGKEAVDIYILNQIQKGDILITQDIGLASLVLPKGVYALSTRGTEYREETIDISLDFRYLASKERAKGKYGKGPKPFSLDDRQKFVKTLNEIVER